MAAAGALECSLIRVLRSSFQGAFMNRTSLAALSLSLFLLPLAGCAPDEAPRSAPEPATRAPIAWGACPEGTPYADTPGVECATIDMPLDHRDASAGTFGYFVARLRSGAPHAPAFWMLDGGPGSSGQEFFYGLVDLFAAAMPEVDLYVPAHRGTGFSAGLVCSGEAWGTPRDTELSPAEWQACANEVTAEWGSKLALFNMTQAADDTAEAIERAREPGQKVFVYGLSYGSSLAIRYLHHHPHQADGIILDSIAGPGSVVLSKTDVYFDPVLADVAAICAADALCGSKMGPDPLAKVASVFASLDAGHCAEAGIDRPFLRQAIAMSLMGWGARALTMAVPYRLARCSPEDVTALQHFVSIWTMVFDLDGFSHALESNIAFNELWEDPAPSAATLAARAEGALASLDWGLERKDVYGFWPKYTPEIAPDAWPKSNVPMLMINGTLDGETPLPLAMQAAQHFDGPHQTFVTIPNAPHGAGYQSPTTLPDGLPCGIDMMASFVAAPHGTPDTSCLGSLKPLPFERPAYAGLVFGTGSLWENVPPPAAPPAAHAKHVSRRRLLD
jgi:pimeloyl-ACP methyl ester carboxylesterase